MHACAYCYARPSHEHLDLGAGTDFDRKIIVKPSAPALLRKAFMKRSWQGEAILFSGNTDCYQPLEAQYKLTRSCLAVCTEFQNPVSIITKSTLVERDIDLLAMLARDAECFVTMSIPFIDAEKSRKIEPFAPTPQRRLKALRKLSEAGIPVGVNIAPVIPGLNDEDIPAILSAARDAGASAAGHILVRLPGAVLPVFTERLKEAFPLRYEKILHRIQEARGGHLNSSQFGDRFQGQGHYWQAISDLFHTTCKRLGLNDNEVGVRNLGNKQTFRRPHEWEQLNLF